MLSKFPIRMISYIFIKMDKTTMYNHIELLMETLELKIVNLILLQQPLKVMKIHHSFLPIYLEKNIVTADTLMDLSIRETLIVSI